MVRFVFLSSEASVQGWVTSLVKLYVSGFWFPQEAGTSFDQREFVVIGLALKSFHHQMEVYTIAALSDKVTPIASYLCKSGGTRSFFLNQIARGFVKTESESIPLPGTFGKVVNCILHGI